MAKSTLVDDIKTGKKERYVCYFKAKVLENHQSEGIYELLVESVVQDSILFTNISTSYVDVSKLVGNLIIWKED